MRSEVTAGERTARTAAALTLARQLHTSLIALPLPLPAHRSWLPDRCAPAHYAKPTAQSRFTSHDSRRTVSRRCTARRLNLRRRAGSPFAHGSHRPLAAEGSQAEHGIAFQRAQHDDALLVVVPRLTGGLGGVEARREVWGDTLIRVPSHGTARSWRCELGGQVVHSQNGVLVLGDLLSRLPVAVLAPHR